MATQDWEPMILRKSNRPSPRAPGPKPITDQDLEKKAQPMPRGIGTQLATARSAKGMTQRQLALALNIDTKTVQLMEQGKHPKDMALAQKMAKKLGCVLKK